MIYLLLMVFPETVEICLSSSHDAQTDSHPVQSLAPMLRQSALATLPADLLAPAGRFTGCEQPAHNRE